MPCAFLITWDVLSETTHYIVTVERGLDILEVEEQP